MDKLPKKIDHDHIVDSVVEVRFVPKQDQSVILDILAAIKSQIPNYRFVPAEIPRQFRQADPQLLYSPELTLMGEKFSVGIGSNTIIFNCQNGYKSWEEFSPFIVSILKSMESCVEKVLRIGVRFTNFFEGQNDLGRFNLTFTAGTAGQIKNDSSNVSQVVLKFSTIDKDVSYNVTIANQARVAKRPLPGTLVDVDAFVDTKSVQFNKDLYDLIENTHEKEKAMFFSLLEKSFLESLHPQY